MFVGHQTEKLVLYLFQGPDKYMDQEGPGRVNKFPILLWSSGQFSPLPPAHRLPSMSLEVTFALEKIPSLHILRTRLWL